MHLAPRPMLRLGRGARRGDSPDLALHDRPHRHDLRGVPGVEPLAYLQSFALEERPGQLERAPEGCARLSRRPAVTRPELLAPEWLCLQAAVVRGPTPPSVLPASRPGEPERRGVTMSIAGAGCCADCRRAG